MKLKLLYSSAGPEYRSTEDVRTGLAKLPKDDTSFFYFHCDKKWTAQPLKVKLFSSYFLKKLFIKGIFMPILASICLNIISSCASKIFISGSDKI